jgi:subtilisin family serine protease
MLITVITLSAVVWGCSGGSSFQVSENGYSSLTQRDLSAAPESGRYIVVLKDNVVDVPGAAKGITRPFGVTVDRTYSHALKGFAVKLPPQALAGIGNNPLVDYIEPDIVLHACGFENGSGFGKPDKPGKPPKPPDDPDPPEGDEVPWGVDRIDADLNAGAKGAGVTVAVLDTGIDTDHSELAADYKGGYDFVNNDGSPEDDAGHGTHVSGIIAADDNESGIVGVAPDAGLVAVKVLNRRGSGYLSWIIDGINWVIANKDAYDIEVANMSFGGPGTSDALHTAIQNLYNAGVTIAVSAGNDGTNAAYFIPASYDEVICVSAIDGSDNFAYFSNWGETIELTAPGVSINSCWLRGRYKAMSGTSMSSPHVAGAAALWLDDHSGTPQQVMDALIAAGEPGPWPGDPDGIAEPLVDAETL